MENCDKFLEQISAYIDNELSTEDRIKFEEHLKNCSDCEKKYIEILEIVNDLNSVPEIELPENFHNEFMNKLVIEQNKKKDIRFYFLEDILKSINRKQVFAAGAVFAALTLFFVTLSSINSGDKYDKENPVAVAEEGILSDINSDFALNTMLNGLDATQNANTSSQASGKVVSDTIKSKGFDDDYVLDYQITITVDNINNTVSEINKLQGYNIYSDITSYGKSNITRKVDKDSVPDIISVLSRIGKVNNFSENRQSIAFSKIDTDAAVKAKSQERERLYALLDKAPDAEYLYKVYDRIMALENEISALNGQLRSYNDTTGSSNITIVLIEKAKAKEIIEDENIFIKCKNAFILSLNATINFFSSIILIFAGLSIPLLIVLLIISAIIIIRRRR